MKEVDLILKSNAIYSGYGDCIRKGFVAIEGERIKYVGSLSEMEEYVDENTKVYDFGEQMIMPGMHDAHLHLFNSALLHSPKMYANVKSHSEEEFVDSLAEHAKVIPEEEWLLGFGWYHSIWENPVLPTKTSIDAVYPNRPVCLIACDLHTLWLNTKGMEILGIKQEDGISNLDDNGDMTGIVQEEVAFKIMPKIFASDDAEIEALLKNECNVLNSYGITSVCDMAPGTELINESVYKKLLEKKEMHVRVHIFPMYEEGLKLHKELREKFPGPVIQFGGVKQLFDGVSAWHTAYLKEPYANPYFDGDRGMPTIPEEEMRKEVLESAKNDFSIRVHTIGDWAVHLMLDYLKEAKELYGHKPYLQHTVEHLDSVLEEDIPRMQDLNVVASVQPQHLVYDTEGYTRDLGEERIHQMWMYRTMMDHEVTLAFGTDAPVVDENPFLSIYAAVTRHNLNRKDEPDLKDGWIPEQKIEVWKALQAYTYGSAIAVHRQHELGQIAPGMYADITVLDRNLLTVDPEKIPETQVVMTILGGKIVYEK